MVLLDVSEVDCVGDGPLPGGRPPGGGPPGGGGSLPLGLGGG